MKQMGKRKKTRDGRIMSKAGKRSLNAWLSNGDPYDIRGYYVHEMGYASYAAYLASPLWWKIRRRVMEQHDGKCAFCLAPATAVHHASYKKAVLKGADISQLYPVCNACHQFGEFDELDRKTTPTEATARMLARAAKNGVAVKPTLNLPSKAAIRHRESRRAKNGKTRHKDFIALPSDAQPAYAGMTDLDRAFRLALASD